MFYTYVLKSLKFSGQIYIGCTKDVKKRLKKHNEGGSSHTSRYKPWALVFFAAFTTKSKALSFEKYLKSSSGKAFMRKRLIS
ncbi:GIY-YIG nuclease family protein [Patescibacteria group bacterium]